jgi:hypothetical protein
MASQPKLTYFTVKGLGETTRVILAVAKVEYEDFRFPLEIPSFAKPEFDAVKASGALDINLGRVPLFTVDGSTIGQSKSIERFAARKYGLMGSTEVEGALCDMYFFIPFILFLFLS